jgi:hypothetical protein
MVFIPGNTPSLKNSKRIVRMGRRTSLIPSKTVVSYVQAHDKDYANGATQFQAEIANKNFPIKVGFYFNRDSKRKFDFINAAQIVQDLMVKHNYLPDDNCDYLVPVFLGYKVDKSNPGVEITVI